VHALAYQMNAALGNIGATVRYLEAPMPAVPARGLADFIEAMRAGTVETLLIWGSNPVYDLPPDLKFGEALGRVKQAVHLGLYDDETGSLCEWQVPESHYLEAWGDALAVDGTPSLIQPLIEPLYPEAASLLEVMSLFVDLPPRRGYEIVRDFWSARMAGGEAHAWERSLNRGVVTGAPGFAGPGLVAGVMAAPAVPAPAPSGLEILFRPDASVGDGRGANNGWLQELPKPLTKLTWDNVAMVSPKSAQMLGVKTGDLANLTVADRSMTVPVWVEPGQADACVSVTLGYGRWLAGAVGNGVGFDANALRSSAQPWALSGARMEALGRWKELATTQDHFTMDGRGFIQVETLEAYRADPARAAETKPEPPAADDFYPPVAYKGHAWGMSIDLNACIGCNACVVACQAENNIPVVGRDQVFRGREMHWIRIDRYFEGDPEEPAIHFQPVTCMQCEQAPCEVVCPVAATVHSSEGLNDMVYNRCVGTRYCSNNCPYKVRRFNFFQYSNERSPVLALQKNPEVTVRSRGVMEKCTYCVQRIEAARIDAQKAMRPIRDGEIVTACQATCPTEAIVFGDSNDPKSRVSRLKAQARNYAVLGELNTHPRTTYLAKVTNPPA
jgi:molybdopterin-containing oxidoreductase family iron-sulfur binding subunit